jgi:hypothetical protein
MGLDEDGKKQYRADDTAGDGIGGLHQRAEQIAITLRRRGLPRTLLHHSKVDIEGKVRSSRESLI